MWAGVAHGVIDDAIAWPVAQMYPCLHSSQDIVNIYYLPLHKLLKTFLSVINVSK